MVEIGWQFQHPYAQHMKLVASSAPLENFDQQLDDLSLLERELREIKLKPYSKLAEHGLRDIAEYRELIAKGDFETAGKRLEAAVVAHKAMQEVEHRIKVVRFRLFTAQRQRGAKRSRTLALGRRELMEIKESINLEHARLLRRNSLRSALGRINSALRLWREKDPDLVKIDKVLKRAGHAFG
jgi:hypothetical protein